MLLAEHPVYGCHGEGSGYIPAVIADARICSAEVFVRWTNCGLIAQGVRLMATTFGILRVPFAEKSTTHPPALSSTPVAPHTNRPVQEFYDTLLGMAGLAITLSVISSGAYVFFRYLL